MTPTLRKWILFLFCLAVFAVGTEVNAAEKTAASKIKVLFISGGHGFKKNDFDAFLAQYPQLEITKAFFPKDRDLLKPGLEKKYDVILFFDMDSTHLTPEQKENYAALLRCGIGVFALHHHICSNQDWPEYYNFLGGRALCRGAVKFRGKDCPASTFKNGKDIDIAIADPEHPITKGVSNFVIHDEAYGRLVVDPNVKVLFTSTHKDQTPQTGWIWRYANSPVFVNLLGHDKTAWMNPNFGRIFIQGVEYLAREVRDQNAFETGVVVRDITPVTSYRMNGYFNERLSTGTSDPLCAKAMVFRQGSQKAALVICDLCSVSPKSSNMIRDRASALTGIPRDAIAVAATHSHTGPLYYNMLRDYLHEQAVKKNNGKDPAETFDYTEYLVEQCVAAISAAFNSIVPVTLQTGETACNTLSFNRRFHMKEGPVVFNPGFKNPNKVRPAGPIDPEIQFAIMRSKGTNRPLASFSNFALHLDTTGGTLFSGDYPFYLSEVLKKKFGQDFISVFGTGTCGDINHLDFAGGRPVIKAPVIGTKLGELIVKAMEGKLETEKPSLKVVAKTALWPRQQYSEERTKLAQSKMEEVFAQKGPFLERVENYKIVEIAAMPKEVKIGIQAIRLSDECVIVALPGEVFVELGLAIKKASPFRRTMIVELSAEQVSAYIPTRKAIKEGSYETVNNFLEPGAGEKLVELAIEALKELKMEN